ncbi:MAG: hypothetical protein O7G85_09945, partial [Planctomycetota bacterium]|nr:hypothetical protein [Planctomycetota bacterium]
MSNRNIKCDRWNIGRGRATTLIGGMVAMIGWGPAQGVQTSDCEIFSGRKIATGNSPFYLAAADFDGDGVQDLAVANIGSDDISVLLGLGDGSFMAHMRFDV